MEFGDLGSWDVQHIVVVLEGVIATPTYEESGHLWRKTIVLQPSSAWPWSVAGLKTMVRYHYHDVSIDIVTFLGDEVSEAAAEFLLARDVPYSSCGYTEYGVFVESLTWRPNITRVVDSHYDRLMHYGSRAYETSWGSEW